MTHTTTSPTTTTTTASNATAMGNGNKKSTKINSFSADDLSKHSGNFLNNRDVTQWSSSDVHNWVKEQCKKYELKKATVEKFEMNGQALALLNKHDFLRRSPDGGEILYYALQRLINPNRVNSARLDQSLSRSRSATQHPRIVELNADDECDCPTDASSPKPIIEEPDDPPKIQRSQSDTSENSFQRQQRPYPRPFIFAQVHPQPPVFAMSAGSAAAYLHQQQQQRLRQQAFTHPQMFAHHPHPHPHMHQQQNFIHPHLMHQYYAKMSAQGILIESMDDLVQHGFIPEGVHGPMNGARESLYMVTMNGQRVIMNEDQVRQLVTEVHQQQVYQQQQQLYQQQQQQQQQYHYQQQQQRQQQPQQQPPQQEQGFPEQHRF